MFAPTYFAPRYFAPRYFSGWGILIPMPAYHGDVFIPNATVGQITRDGWAGYGMVITEAAYGTVE